MSPSESATCQNGTTPTVKRMIIGTGLVSGIRLMAVINNPFDASIEKGITLSM